jgi:hypothetical protein
MGLSTQCWRKKLRSKMGSYQVALRMQCASIIPVRDKLPVPPSIVNKKNQPPFAGTKASQAWMNLASDDPEFIAWVKCLWGLGLLYEPIFGWCMLTGFAFSKNMKDFNVYKYRNFELPPSFIANGEQKFNLYMLQLCEDALHDLEFVEMPPTRQDWAIWSRRPFTQFELMDMLPQAKKIHKMHLDQPPLWKAFCETMPKDTLFALAANYPFTAGIDNPTLTFEYMVRAGVREDTARTWFPNAPDNISDMGQPSSTTVGAAEAASGTTVDIGQPSSTTVGVAEAALGTTVGVAEAALVTTVGTTVGVAEAASGTTGRQ